MQATFEFLLHNFIIDFQLSRLDDKKHFCCIFRITRTQHRNSGIAGMRLWRNISLSFQNTTSSIGQLLRDQIHFSWRLLFSQTKIFIFISKKLWVVEASMLSNWDQSLSEKSFGSIGSVEAEIDSWVGGGGSLFTKRSGLRWKRHRVPRLPWYWTCCNLWKVQLWDRTRRSTKLLRPYTTKFLCYAVVCNDQPRYRLHIVRSF